MLKAILFDLDNTLLDFSRFKRESALVAAKAIRKAGVGEMESKLHKQIFEIYEKNGIEYQNTFQDLLSRYELGPSLYEHAKQAAIIAYQKKKYTLLKPRQKVIRTLSSLRKKYKLGIVTDAPREKAWQRLILSGLDHMFDTVVTYHDTMEYKPSKQPFLKAMHMLGVTNSEVLFVGDNPERDIIGAKKAGLTTCLAKYGCQNYSQEEDVADYTIEKFEEILKVVKDV
ncbi:MAG: HAD family hydrolase [Candidatus Micrarchaeota archaeon]